MTETAETSTEVTEQPRYAILNQDIVSDVEPAPEEVATPAEPEDVEEPEPEIEAVEKKKRDAQSRIRELNARAKAAEERAAQLEEQLNGKQKPAQREPDNVGLVKPNPENYKGGRYSDEYAADFENYLELKAEQKAITALENSQRTLKIESEKAVIRAKEDAFRAQHADYDDALSYANQAGIFNDGVADALVELDNVAEIVYMIGTDDELISELAALSPAARLMRIGALTSNKSATETKTAKSTSKAPPPVTPIHGGSAVLAGTAAIEAAEKSMNYDAWKAAKKAAGLK